MGRSTLVSCLTIGSALSAAGQTPTSAPQEISPLLDLPPALTQAFELPRPTAGVAVFIDDFSRATLDLRKWAKAHNVTLAEPGALPRGVKITGSPAGSDWPGELRSVAIDLSAVGSAELALTASPRGASPEFLVVDYFAVDRQWRSLDRSAALLPGQIASIFAVPPDGLHADFAFRCRALGSPQDAWLIQDVSVRVPKQASDRSLVVDSVPLWGAKIRIVPSGKPLIEQSGLTHLAKVVPGDAKITLVAAAELSGWVFDHWEVQNVAQPAAQRAITLDPAGELTAVAHFRRMESGDALTLSVKTSPRAGVRVQIGSGPDVLFDEVASAAEVRLVRGETATLLAPERTGELVFSHWNVGGRDLAPGEVRCTRKYESDTTALAMYFLLGDMNDDDSLDRDDVDAFVQALVAPMEYAKQFPAVNRSQRGDVNGDGAFDEQDIESFVELLVK